MSNPLELTVYPPLVCEGDRPKDRLKHEFSKGAERKRAEAKRFTDAELAAEVWKQDVSVSAVEASGGTAIRTLAKYETFERFAKLPHYDEADQ